MYYINLQEVVCSFCGVYRIALIESQKTWVWVVILLLPKNTALTGLLMKLPYVSSADSILFLMVFCKFSGVCEGNS